VHNLSAQSQLKRQEIDGGDMEGWIEFAKRFLRVISSQNCLFLSESVSFLWSFLLLYPKEKWQEKSE